MQIALPQYKKQEYRTYLFVIVKLKRGDTEHGKYKY